MAVPDAVLLFAVGRAHARIHVKHDAFRRATTMDDIDPLAGKIGERQQVLFGSKPLSRTVPSGSVKPHGPEPPCRRQSSASPDRGVGAQRRSRPHIQRDAKHRLSRQTYQRMAAVLACARIGKRLARHRGQAEARRRARGRRTIRHQEDRPRSRETAASPGGRNRA